MLCSGVTLADECGLACKYVGISSFGLGARPGGVWLADLSRPGEGYGNAVEFMSAAVACGLSYQVTNTLYLGR